jgi:kinesin family member 5
LKLDSIETPESLTLDDMSTIRRQLVDGQHVLKETTDKLRQLQKDHEAIARKKDEIETRHATLEVEYEELLGKW